ncbi:MAG: hypothetical protein V2I67_02930 [Thermoanaerobaculales bacterium]|jgi:hypothetical protein|nr:hypothetical protein [Thermoanaerobaculales bacterium]
METLFLTFVVFLLAVVAMAAGAIATGRSLKGSCGGPSCSCAAEGKDITRCRESDDDEMSLPVLPGT